MSTQQQVSSIAEYNRSAILKYCNENRIIKHQLDELFTSNNPYKLGMCCWFIGFLYFYVDIYIYF